MDVGGFFFEFEAIRIETAMLRAGLLRPLPEGYCGFARRGEGDLGDDQGGPSFYHPEGRRHEIRGTEGVGGEDQGALRRAGCRDRVFVCGDAGRLEL